MSTAFKFNITLQRFICVTFFDNTQNFLLNNTSLKFPNLNYLTKNSQLTNTRLSKMSKLHVTLDSLKLKIEMNEGYNIWY